LKPGCLAYHPRWATTGTESKLASSLTLRTVI
jgi:hypothetical protein